MIPIEAVGTCYISRKSASRIILFRSVQIDEICHDYMSTIYALISLEIIYLSHRIY